MIIPSGNVGRDADLLTLNQAVPEIAAHRQEMLKLNPGYKQVVRDAGTNPGGDNGQQGQAFTVEESLSTHNVAWNTFLVTRDPTAVLVLDTSADSYISLDEWRAKAAATPVILPSWDVRLGTHTYKVTVSIDNQQNLQVEADEAGLKTKLFSESFGTATSLEIAPLESGTGTKTILVSAGSGSNGDDRRATVVTSDPTGGQLALSPHPFSKLNAARLSDLLPQIKDIPLKEWVTGQYMGFRTARFQAFTPTGPAAGSVTFNVGSLPVLVSGTADVQYDFNEGQFQLAAITRSAFSDALANPACKNIVKVQDPEFGEILAWSESKSTYRFAGINASYLNQAGVCGESLDKPLKNGSTYLIETIVRYKDKPELLKALLDAWKVNTQIRDKNGRSAYAIALAVGVNEPVLLDRLREGMTKDQAAGEEQAVKLALQGSKLSLDEIKAIVKSGISVNTDMSAYAYLLSGQESDHNGGTILANAIIAGDYEKTKWLLENGADANLKFGSGESRRSPLQAALTKDAKIAELLLQHKANADEVYSNFPVQLSLLAGNRCSADKVALLKKYGATKWTYQDPSPAMKIDYKTEEEIMKLVCK